MLAMLSETAQGGVQGRRGDVADHRAVPRAGQRDTIGLRVRRRHSRASEWFADPWRGCAFRALHSSARGCRALTGPDPREWWEYADGVDVPTVTRGASRTSRGPSRPRDDEAPRAPVPAPRGAGVLVR